MASFTLNWTPIITANVLSQRAYFRQKTVGGTFLDTGFTPSNPLNNSAVTVTHGSLLANTVYEFQIANICEDGGPTFNQNGIIEIIDFQCSGNPGINGITSTTATITIGSLTPDINKVTLTVVKVSDSSLVYTEVLNPIGGTVNKFLDILEENTEYRVNATYGAIVQGVQIYDSSVTCSTTFETTEVVCGSATLLTSSGNLGTLDWVADQQSCESAGGFAVVKTITGLSDPDSVMYHQDSNRVFVGDLGAPSGNIYSFNPDTATTAGDVTYVPGLAYNPIYKTAMDEKYGRVYLVGQNTGGMIPYSIANNTILSTVSFGTNGGSFNRTALYILGDRIYCNDATNSIVIIDRANLTVLSTVSIPSTIPIGGRFQNPFFMQRIGDKIYVSCNNGTVGSIGVYNLGLTTNTANISLPGSALWIGGSNRYYQPIYYDNTPRTGYPNGVLYAGDIGSSKQYLIDPATDTVIAERTMLNKGNKANVECGWILDPNTNSLYMYYSGKDTPGDVSPVNRMYKENRDNFTGFLYMYESFFISKQPTGVTGTSKVIGAALGAPWSGGAWATDGTITVLDNAAAGNNTGVRITNTLKEVNVSEGNTITGNYKPNYPSDPDYIAPYIDYTACPISTTLTCPTDVVTTTLTGPDQVVYEFSVSNANLNNPDLDIIEVYAINAATNIVDGAPVIYTAPFATNYFSGIFTGKAAANYNIRIVYKTAPNTTILTCNP